MPRWAHRTSYAAIARGRDRYVVNAIGGWLEPVIGRELRQRGGSVRVIDVGCGGQPLRELVEREGAAYVGFDIEQNSRSSVQIVGFIDRELPSPWPDHSQTYDLVLCTEVLEHVIDWDASFRNLRALVAPSGAVVVTVPFYFPLHMAPVDYFRGTSYAIEALAEKHRFAIVEFAKLGDVRDVLATCLDDISVLPATPTLPARVAARVLRTMRDVLVTILQARFPWRLVHVNANTYLSNAVVLRPR